MWWIDFNGAWFGLSPKLNSFNLPNTILPWSLMPLPSNHFSASIHTLQFIAYHYAFIFNESLVFVTIKYRTYLGFNCMSQSHTWQSIWTVVNGGQGHKTNHVFSTVMFSGLTFERKYTLFFNFSLWSAAHFKTVDLHQ